MAENAKPLMSAPGSEPQLASPASDAPGAAEPLPDDWREATLLRLEAWVEERERLIDDLERRIEERAATVALPPSAFSSAELADWPGHCEAAGNVVAKP